MARAERQVDRLDRLVNDLLDVSRVQAGKLELHLEPTDLATDCPRGGRGAAPGQPGAHAAAGVPGSNGCPSWLMPIASGRS